MTRLLKYKLLSLFERKFSWDKTRKRLSDYVKLKKKTTYFTLCKCIFWHTLFHTLCHSHQQLWVTQGVPCQAFREKIRAKARLVWVGHFLSQLTQNKRAELQDNVATWGYNWRIHSKIQALTSVIILLSIFIISYIVYSSDSLSGQHKITSWRMAAFVFRLNGMHFKMYPSGRESKRRFGIHTVTEEVDAGKTIVLLHPDIDYIKSERWKV